MEESEISMAKKKERNSEVIYSTSKEIVINIAR